MDISSLNSASPIPRDLASPPTGGVGLGGAAGASSAVAETAISMPGFSPTSDVSAGAAKAAGKTLDMKSALTQANQMLQQQASTSLQFQVDPSSKQTVVQMIDVNSKEVIKQFPSEEFLRMASVVDTLQKQLVNEKV